MAYKRRRYRRSRRGRLRAYRRRGRRTIARVVNRVLMKKNEIKYKPAGAEGLDCYHNRGLGSAGALTSNQGTVVFNPWAYIQQGTTSQERIGSEVHPRGMSVRMHYAASADRNNQHIRVIVCTIPKVSNGIINDGSNFNLFDTTAGVPNNVLCGFRKDDNGIRILYDRVYNVKSVIQGTSINGYGRLFKRFFIRRKRASKIVWERVNEIVNKPLCVYVLPYDYNSVARTDILGKIDLFYKLYFRDI